MTTEAKALALLNEVRTERGIKDPWPSLNRASFAGDEALCRAIEQHEAFRQEVSDAVWDYYGGKHIPRTSMFAKFAIPKPDPLVEVLNEMEKGRAKDWAQQGYADNFRAALDALGFEIREKNDGHV